MSQAKEIEVIKGKRSESKYVNIVLSDKKVKLRDIRWNGSSSYYNSLGGYGVGFLEEMKEAMKNSEKMRITGGVMNEGDDLYSVYINLTKARGNNLGYPPVVIAEFLE